MRVESRAGGILPECDGAVVPSRGGAIARTWQSRLAGSLRLGLGMTGPEYDRVSATRRPRVAATVDPVYDLTTRHKEPP